MSDIIAVVFDFDDTLAPDSTSGFLAELGIDVRDFWMNRVQKLIESGWDPIPAYLYRLIELSRPTPGAPARITRDRLAAWGRKLRFHPGVTRMFKHIRAHAAALDPRIQIEFYIVSSGIGEIVRNTRIAGQFTDIWACEFHYAPDGGILFPKNIISFTDKTRFLFQICKGLIGPEFRSRPFEVNRRVPPEKQRAPFDQMIFVGDGYTDVPCFSLVRAQGGTAIGVYDPKRPEKWDRAWGFIEDGRVSNLAPADYRAESALSNSLRMAVSSIGRRILQRRGSDQGG